MSDKRIYHFDLIRAISVICIIGIHTIDPVIPTVKVYGVNWWYVTILQVIVRIGLPMFFVISGALILNSKNDSLLSFYSKRFIKILIPLFIYSFMYLFIYNYKFSIIVPGNFIACIKQILAGPIFYHLWFVYTMLGLYLVSPFIKVMVRNMSDSLIIALIIIIIIMRGISTYLPIININIGINSYVFDGWILYFIIGYALTRDTILKKSKIIYYLGALSFVATLILIRFVPAGTKNIFDFAPTIILMVSAVFTLFSNNREKINQKMYFRKSVKIISKYSYSIYLVHALVLAYILNDKFGINGTFINLYIGIIVTIILTLLISLIISIVIDNVITNNVFKFYDKLIKIKKD